tara:strand:+ start:2262 stop:2666 length:405 start_codon:yes stop_codon:yes gene_type:complete
MPNQEYLVAIALIEQLGERAIPLGGKELKKEIKDNEEIGSVGDELILNLLLRVFQRSQDGLLKRSAMERSLLLVKINVKRMQKELPFIKSEWIRDGDTEKFIKYLTNLSEQIWSVSFVKFKGIEYNQISSKDID